MRTEVALEAQGARAIHPAGSVAMRAELAGQAAIAALVGMVAPRAHLLMAVSPAPAAPRPHVIDLDAEHARDRRAAADQARILRTLEARRAAQVRSLQAAAARRHH